jgi:hypothetical protein
MNDSHDSIIYPLRIDVSLHKDLKKLSFLREESMAEIIRDGIRLKIKEYRKMLTNSNITV